MMAMSGGSFMSGMPSMGGAAFSHVNQGPGTKTDCLGVELCKSTCEGRYTIGPLGSDGCPSCECNSVSGKPIYVPYMYVVLILFGLLSTNQTSSLL